ncbi:MAG TPA: N-acetyl-gamma-glutamyl-phosphate reductase [Chitinispirillaceae bacterium]|jgi:N-acetyl-gamma-glutamyl-phosphate reductase|nr:N-acetyl-gamma-glutamyl-phosphate reductase [Chitinispirillaceae bacterium]
MATVFIDGQEGTTGLRILERLKPRKDIELLEIPSEKRKDIATKTEFLNNADAVIFCLPDQAARESSSLITNPKTKVIDASTAFRTAPDWVYGMPELSKGQREKLRTAKRISNPGCHATGFIISIVPLRAAGIVGEDYPAVCYSLTGYSGGGKKMIARYQDPQNTEELRAPMHYGLTLSHKHIPEMQKYTGLQDPPLFLPVVSSYYNGMVVSIPLYTQLLRKKVSVEDVHGVLSSYYDSEPFIRVLPLDHEQILDNGYLSPIKCNETNMLDLFVFGKDKHIVVMARFDNLGKGASGAAVQNMNIALGLEETAGLLS